MTQTRASGPATREDHPTSLTETIDRRQFLRVSTRTALTAALLGSGASALLAGCGPTNPATIESSDQLFQAGRFAEADKGYAQVLAHDPKNVHALTQRGHVALLSNRLAEAQRLFEQSLELAPGDPQATRLLALTFYRADDFGQAAKLGYQTPLLESFQGRTPYEIHGPDGGRVRFLQTNPLLLVDVAVHGLEPVPFVVDTGSTTVLLHPDLAQRAGVTLFSLPAGARAIGTGGQQIDAGQMARVDRVTLGDFEIRNIPGATGTYIARGVRAPDGRPVQGAIGTTFLGHFLSTLDYPGATLVLRRKTPALLRQFEGEAKAAAAAQMPFWIYTDHFIVTLGKVNGHGPMVFTVDTGANADYASMAFLPTDTTVEQAGINVDKSKATRFVGSGGESIAYPIQLDEVALGSVVRHNLPGAAGVWPSRRVRGAVEPVIGGAVSSAFLSLFALTIDTVGMRLFLAQGGKTS
ncbi:MAG TPA: aspartyl protease family protein [Chloroflexota bacterium]|nr:aspartyl protease family protein [Chloroflexota bacterium]